VGKNGRRKKDKEDAPGLAADELGLAIGLLPSFFPTYF
jgi:hypothetical protein